MPPDNRLPPPAPSRTQSPPFYRVERREADGRTRHFVVHTESPKFMVEFDREPPSPGDPTASLASRQRPVLRRVCVPNSWAGDYHRCARQLGAAADFFAATEATEA